MLYLAGADSETTHHLERLRRRCGWIAILSAQSDQSREREQAAGRVELSHRRRKPVSVQSRGGRWRDVRDGQEQFHCCARCNNRQRDLVASERARADHHARTELLESADRKDRRLFYANANFLVALDAKTGEPISSFGVAGKIDLREGLGRDTARLNVQSLTPGRVFENLIIVGSSTNQEYDSAPGDLRAYDARTGKLVWTFHTIPHEGEFGYDTWPNTPEPTWKTVGGANAWSEMSIDTQRGILYVPTASPKYNFYGADRKGANLFGDCLLALDVRTGKRLWHFQMVHHDIWDYDNPEAPKLLTVRHNGKMVDVVAEAGKTGFLYVFNRVTGEPLWPIEERPVPKSDMPGEQAWPTQPFPTAPPPFARQSFTVKDLSPYFDDAAEAAHFRDDIAAARNEGLFTPPGCATRSRCRAIMAGRTSAARPWIPSTPQCSWCRKIFPRC